MSTSLARPEEPISLAPSPMSFLRCSLFAAAERTTKTLRNQPLATAKKCGITAVYSGPQLTQAHAMVWQAIIREHARRSGGDIDAPLVITQAALLRALGRTDTSTKSRRQLWEKLKDLQGAIIELRSPKHSYSGQLVGEVLKNEETGQLRIFLNRKLGPLLSDELASIDLDRKLSLGRHQLACWLHDFISTQSNLRFIPWPVDELRELSGSTLKIAQFRQSLKEAIILLSAGDCPLLDASSTHINRADFFVYTKKSPTKVTLISDDANRKWQAESLHADLYMQAQERRGRVAL